MAKAAAQELDILNLKSSQLEPTTHFFASGSPERFARSAQGCLGFVPEVRSVALPGIVVEAAQVLNAAVA
jgi:glutamate racemase